MLYNSLGLNKKIKMIAFRVYVDSLAIYKSWLRSCGMENLKMESERQSSWVYLLGPSIYGVRCIESEKQDTSKGDWHVPQRTGQKLELKRQWLCGDWVGLGEIFDGLSVGWDLRNVVYGSKRRSSGWKLLELSTQLSMSNCFLEGGDYIS